MNTRTAVSLGGLVLLAGFSYALLRWVESSFQQPAPPKTQAPVLIVEDFRAVRLNPAGLRAYVITAPILKHFPDGLGTEIQQPVMDWYQPNGQLRAWRLQSESGWIAADRQLVRLDGVVTMRRLAEGGKIPMTIVTRDLRIQPEERYAETAELTKAVMPSGELQGVGARAWLDQERLELLSQVKGSHEPQDVRATLPLR